METLIKNSNKMFSKPITTWNQFVIRRKKKKRLRRPLIQPDECFMGEKAHPNLLRDICFALHLVYFFLCIELFYNGVKTWMNETSFLVCKELFFFLYKSQYPSTFQLCVNECVCIVCMNYWSNLFEKVILLVSCLCWMNDCF